MKIDTKTLKRYMSPAAYKDLDTFLEQLPMRAGKSALIAGISSWVLACLSITYVFMQANHILALRADILKAEALKPTVPIINQSAVDGTEVEAFGKKLTDLYPQLTIIAAGNRIEMRAPTTDKYGAFREAVGHCFNGGKGWRLAMESMCVGRECKNNTPVYGAFTVYRLRVDKPSS